VNVNRLAALLPAALSVATLAAASAPVTMSFFCQANAPKSKVLYLTAAFTATAAVSDVTKAWQRHIANEDPKAKVGICQAGVDLPSLEELRQLTRDSTASTQPVVDVDWTFEE
jgi:hypothetical protein